MVVASSPVRQSCSTAWLVLDRASTGRPAASRAAVAAARVVVLPCPAGAINARRAGPGPQDAHGGGLIGPQMRGCADGRFEVRRVDAGPGPGRQAVEAVEGTVFDPVVSDGRPVRRGPPRRVAVDEPDHVPGGQEPPGQGLDLRRGPGPGAGGGDVFDDLGLAEAGVMRAHAPSPSTSRANRASRLGGRRAPYQRRQRAPGRSGPLRWEGRRRRPRRPSAQTGPPVSTPGSCAAGWPGWRPRRPASAPWHRRDGLLWRPGGLRSGRCAWRRPAATPRRSRPAPGTRCYPRPKPPPGWQ